MSAERLGNAILSLRSARNELVDCGVLPSVVQAVMLGRYGVPTGKLDLDGWVAYVSTLDAEFIEDIVEAFTLIVRNRERMERNQTLSRLRSELSLMELTS